ncbi:DUF6630 family protein [Aquipseudomonas campi]
MHRFITFDWKAPLHDVLDVIRQVYAEPFPQLGSSELDELLQHLRDDTAEDFLPPLGQVLHQLGLALIERETGDDSIDLFIIESDRAAGILASLLKQGEQAKVQRQSATALGKQTPGATALVPGTAYQQLEQAEHLLPGLAIAQQGTMATRMLVDLRQWPCIKPLAEQPHGAVLCTATSPTGRYAWVRSNPSGQPYAWLCGSDIPHELTLAMPASPLPPAPSSRQRRAPEFALGFAGDDLLLTDRGMLFIYRDFTKADSEVSAEPVFEAPQPRRAIDNPPAVFDTVDGRVCLVLRGQFFEWRNGQIQPLVLTGDAGGPADPAHATSVAPASITWLEEDALCHGSLDSGHITRHALSNLAEGRYLRLHRVNDDWLLLACWLQPHRSRDLGQLWHPASGQVLRIHYGMLDLPGGLLHWTELPDGQILVGDHERHVALGNFESLRERLSR